MAIIAIIAKHYYYYYYSYYGYYSYNYSYNYSYYSLALSCPPPHARGQRRETERDTLKWMVGAGLPSA